MCVQVHLTLGRAGGAQLIHTQFSSRHIMQVPFIHFTTAA